jgi:hypothetical protein
VGLDLLIGQGWNGMEWIWLGLGKMDGFGVWDVVVVGWMVVV